MQAFEVSGHIDKRGKLKISSDIPLKSGEVKVIIMYCEEADERLWLQSIARNPTFDFLNEPDEDIYSPADGKPFNENDEV